MADLPRGTASLLFTDIQGSTQLQHRLQDRYREVVNEHRRLLEEAIESNGGQVVDRQTESFFAVFPRMRDAASAATAAQRALAAHEWPDGAQVKVRMGIHAGEPELEGDRYVGLAVSRAARVAASAYGGQVLLSGAARGLLADERFRVRPLGSYPLKDFDSPEPLFQLEIDGIPDRFPRPRVAMTRSRRRSAALAAGALVGVALVAAFAALLLGRSDGGLSLIHPNNLGVIDAKTNELVAEVPVGIRPGPVALGDGSLWVGNLDDRSLTRVDPMQRAATATISLERRTPTGVAAGEGSVWVAHGQLGQLSRVDPQFGQLVETIDVAPRGYAQGVVAVGAGSVWAAYGESTLARIDPARVRVVASSFAGGVPSALVVARGSVWVANAGDSTVSRFDPTTLEEGALRTVSVGRRPAAIAYGDDAIWVANAGDGTITRIEPSTYSTTTIPVGSEPVAVAAGAGGVWVANSADRTVSRIDPATNEVVRTIEVGNAPVGVVVADGFVWLAVVAP